MPLFEYVCDCGFQFERQKPISERETHTCPQCGQTARKVMSVVNNTFGWRLDEQSHIKGHQDNYERAV